MMCTIILKWGEYMSSMCVPHFASMGAPVPLTTCLSLACLGARVIEEIERARISHYLILNSGGF